MRGGNKSNTAQTLTQIRGSELRVCACLLVYIFVLLVWYMWVHTVCVRASVCRQGGGGGGGGETLVFRPLKKTLFYVCLPLGEPCH